MHKLDDETIGKFITDRYGEDECSHIKNIHRGGLNNQKGRDYEDSYLLHKIISIAATNSNDKCEDQIIWVQSLAYVDDICHIDGKNRAKYNYQAKNTSIDTHNWTDDISDRFRKQRIMDLELYKVKSSHNILLVSKEVVAQNNNNKIPEDLRGYDCSEYFPFYNTHFELSLDPEINKNIRSLIGEKSSRSDIDYSLMLLRGILQSNEYETVNDIFTRGASDSHPNPFLKYRDDSPLPEWLAIELDKRSIKYSKERGVLKVDIPLSGSSFRLMCLISRLPSIKPDINSLNDVINLITSASEVN